MEITNLKTEQLKALAYDQIKIFENAKRNLEILNQEINKREETQRLAKSTDVSNTDSAESGTND